ncbi:MAG: hypothetical protein GQ529_01230, partial [Methyloprofundus sp.]|nr:hypothetical protein [Methyloprofundus sp.]
MKQYTLPILCASILAFSQSGIAAGVDTRIERRSDSRQNTADRVNDKQDFREERRDCVGDGAD